MKFSIHIHDDQAVGWATGKFEVDDLLLDFSDFSKRFLEPAFMAALRAKNDCILQLPENQLP